MFMPTFPTDLFDPITRTLFLDFIAILFIAEDLYESPEMAWELMVSTGDYGVMLHGDVESDSELEEILESNVRALIKEHASWDKAGLGPLSLENAVCSRSLPFVPC